MFIKVTDKETGLLLLLNTAHILGINTNAADGLGCVIKLAVGDCVFAVSETLDELTTMLTKPTEPWVRME